MGLYKLEDSAEPRGCIQTYRLAFLLSLYPVFSALASPRWVLWVFAVETFKISTGHSNNRYCDTASGDPTVALMPDSLELVSQASSCSRSRPTLSCATPLFADKFLMGLIDNHITDVFKVLLHHPPRQNRLQSFGRRYQQIRNGKRLLFPHVLDCITMPDCNQNVKFFRPPQKPV